MLDGAHEFRIAQRLQECGTCVHEVSTQPQQVRHEGLESLRIDAGIGLELAERRELALQFLQHILSLIHI